MNYKILGIVLVLIFGTSLKASVSKSYYSNADSSIVVCIKSENVSSNLDDGKVVCVPIKNSKDSICYYWEFTGNGINDTAYKSVREGVPFNLIVYNKNGDSLKIQHSVIASAINEKLSAVMTPLVNAMSTFIFWDPFEAMGMHDGFIKDENGVVAKHKNGDPIKKNIPFVVVWLIVGAIFFTIRTKFINIRGLKYSVGLLRGKYADTNEAGEVSHFQALTTALSATVGLGNISGVAIAVVLGGPGAVFWLIVAGFLGMTSKFVECTLGVKYRNIKDGVVSGGPMYYLSKGFADKGYKNLGKILAVTFAILCVGGSFGGGNMFQANQAFAQVQNMFPAMAGEGFAFGIFLAILVGVVIVGGIQKIANVTDKLVPVMCGLYIVFALIIIGMNFSNVGLAFSKIINGAFSPDALKGGFIGVLIIGFKRAAFSNEAGVGSAAIAHSAVKTNRPVTEGLVALLEPFIDTVIICTMTGLVLIFTGFDENVADGVTGSQLTSMAFGSVFPWFTWVLLITIFLFAYSTMISWSYYGLKAWEYLFGASKKSEITYKLIFLVFVVIGSSVELGSVLDFSDLMILGMAFPNMIGMYFLFPVVLKELKAFIADVKSNKIKE